MDYYEKSIKVLMGDVKKYNLIEFYHEQEGLKKQIKEIKDSIKNYNLYIPKY